MSRFRVSHLAAVVIFGCAIAAGIRTGAGAPAAQDARDVYVRVTLLTPKDDPWQVQVVQVPSTRPVTHFAGAKVAEKSADAGFRAPGESSDWIALPGGRHGSTVRFLFDLQAEKGKAKPATGVQARIDVASAADEASILRSVSDHDPGNIIAIRIPPEPAKEKERILTIREDAQRRLDQVKALHLPDGPLPVKLWCLTGFRSNGEFYTDPAIAEMDMQTIRLLGMNGYHQQSGGQPGNLRQLAHANGFDRSTVFWRSIETLPRQRDGRPPALKWDVLEEYVDQAYRKSIANTRSQHPDGMPQVIADLMDEPDGLTFDGGREYQQAFRTYAREQGLTCEQFGKPTWEDVTAIVPHWRMFFTQRSQLDLNDVAARRLFYWSAKFWNHVTARMYSIATRKVEAYAPGVLTRVNFGPPWVYDYGTLPRGIDAFEFGRLRGVTLGFNEDWVGKGSPRVPLEMNTLLMDWSRAAARPRTPLLGCYITRDADRATVKLRTFACLAREAKIFDFYYYGPDYTFFDPWSDNASMVQGVGELTRDLGAVDDELWNGRAPAAQAALLYSQSWPVWKEDDTEQCEQMMAYLALLHAGIPVDLVSDTEVADGRFAARGYKCLYVVNESIPAAAADRIERWVHDGGKLWASGWAGMRDEYNTPTDRWNAMLGITARSWKPAGDLKRLGQPIRPDDWLRPIFGREVTLQHTADAGMEAVDIPGAPGKAERRHHGAGLVQIVPWTAGKQYMDGATEMPASLAKATLFPSDGRRAVFAGFATDAGASPPAVTSQNQILAWPLWTQHKGVVLLANYTGEPSSELTVTVTTPLPITHARALHAGDLTVAHPDADHIRLTLPMKDVTDILVLE